MAHWTRDPAWQFVGVVVAAVALTIGFTPADVQPFLAPSTVLVVVTVAIALARKRRGAPVAATPDPPAAVRPRRQVNWRRAGNAVLVVVALAISVWVLSFIAFPREFRKAPEITLVTAPVEGAVLPIAPSNVRGLQLLASSAMMSVSPQQNLIAVVDGASIVIARMSDGEVVRIVHAGREVVDVKLSWDSLAVATRRAIRGHVISAGDSYEFLDTRWFFAPDYVRIAYVSESGGDYAIATRDEDANPSGIGPWIRRSTAKEWTRTFAISSCLAMPAGLRWGSRMAGARCGGGGGAGATRRSPRIRTP